MKSVDIAVIILNYNTSEDALTAAKSVIDNTKHSFQICLVDNASPKKEKLNVFKITIYRIQFFFQ